MKLEELLEQAYSNPEKRMEFINTLINSEVILIGTKATQKNENGEEFEGLNMFSVKNNEDKNIVPFFSDVEPLKLFASKVATGNPPAVKLSCINFFKMVAANNAGAVLNPNSKYSKEFSAEEIQAILGSIKQAVSVPDASSGENVLITQPKNPPEELIKEIKKFCGTRLDILNAYAFDIVYPGKKPHFLLVLDCEFEREELYEKVKELLDKHFLNEDDEYEVMSAKQELIRNFVRSQIPFYSKFGEVKR